jgi:transcriptional antiterminator RfaH
MIAADVPDRRRWYVVQTKPRQDVRAESNLRRWNVQTFAPKVREVRRSAGGETSYRVAPLFPNYLFARFDADVLTAKIRLTRGIQRVVGFGEYATPVDDAIVRLIQEQIADDGFVRARDLQPGDAVEIIDGPLRSFVGVFERRTCARDRVVILLTTIGGHQRVQVAEAAMRKTTP